MNISSQLKNYRKELRISQEDLAEKIHVSRVTISNWENDKSYPDIQSLVMLSEYFKISLDELVKGDIVEMKKEVQRKDLDKYSSIMAIGTIIIFLGLIVGFKYEPYGFILPIIAAAIVMWAAIKVEKIKKREDIQTYKEIIAFIENKEMPVKEERDKYSVVKKFLIGTVAGGAMAALAIFIVERFL